MTLAADVAMRQHQPKNGSRGDILFGPSLKKLSAKLQRLLKAEVERQGINVLHLHAFGYLYDSAFWVAVPTDAERDRLINDHAIVARMNAFFEDTGYLDLARKKCGRKLAAIGEAVVANIVFESQETVDRDYQGSWLYATR